MWKSKALIFLGLICVMAVGIYFLMRLLGVSSVDGLQQVVNSYGIYAYAIIIVLQVIQVVFIPISNQLITIPCIAVLGTVPTFFCAWIGIEIGTIILYLIGRTGGKKLLGWILSDNEKVERFSQLLNKSKFFYPIGMVIGVIPDDIITTLAGVAKFNFLYVLIVSVIARGICIACTVFGIGVLCKTWWGIVLFIIGAIAVIIFGYLYLSKESIKNGRTVRRKK